VAWAWSVSRRDVRKGVRRPFIRKDGLDSNSDVKFLNEAETTDSSIYYVYFDRYRRPRTAVREMKLREKYDNDPGAFLKAMETPEQGEGRQKALGHVGILRFESEGELKDFFENTGEEVIGFYECKSDSRPYDF
jgi:hypothetical protein